MKTNVTCNIWFLEQLPITKTYIVNLAEKVGVGRNAI